MTADLGYGERRAHLPIRYCQLKEVGKRIPLVEKSGTGNQTWCDVMTGRLPDGGGLLFGSASGIAQRSVRGSIPVAEQYWC